MKPSLPAAVSTCKMAMYDQTYFRGKSIEISGSVNDFETINFDNSIASVKVKGDCCWTLLTWWGAVVLVGALSWWWSNWWQW